MNADIPPSLYAHPDPLISRLRLNNSEGQPLLDPAGSSSELRDAVVVAFLFGAEVERENNDYAKKIYQGVRDLTRRSPHRLKCIYVSIDPSENSFQESVRGKPWLSCIWQDGSKWAGLVDVKGIIALTLTVLNSADKSVAMLQTAYDEDFIQTVEEDTSANSQKNSSAYQRPFSRVGLASKFDVLTVPTLCIYHLPSSTILSHSVKPIELRSDNLDTTLEAWERGKPTPAAINASMSTKEIVYRMRWTLALAFAAVVYQFLRVVGGFDISPLLQKIFVPDAALEQMGQMGLEK